MISDSDHRRWSACDRPKGANSLKSTAVAGHLLAKNMKFMTFFFRTELDTKGVQLNADIRQLPIPPP